MHALFKIHIIALSLMQTRHYRLTKKNSRLNHEADNFFSLISWRSTSSDGISQTLSSSSYRKVHDLLKRLLELPTLLEARGELDHEAAKVPLSAQPAKSRGMTKAGVYARCHVHYNLGFPGQPYWNHCHFLYSYCTIQDGSVLRCFFCSR